MPAVAVTDDANLFGAMQFCAAAKKAGVQPIVGACWPLAPSRRPRTPGRPAPPEQLVLLVKDAEGYANLLRLMSRAYLGAEPGAGARVRWTELARIRQGLILPHRRPRRAGRRGPARAATPAAARSCCARSRLPSATGSMSS